MTRLTSRSIFALVSVCAAIAVAVSSQHFGSVHAQSAGLVAAYAFDEGSGATTADASGNGNTGTISAATWSTAGKFSNALKFNGSSAAVTVNNAASLGLTSAM